MGLTHSPKIVRDGLVLHLDAANVKSYPGSGTTWKDLSGQGNNGTLVGPTFSAENKGNLIFDGISDIVNTPVVLESPVDIPTTFEIVFKYNSTAAFRGLMGASAYQNSGFSIGFAGGNSLRWTYNGSGVSLEPVFSYGDLSIISFGTFIFDGRDLRAYRDGYLVNTSTASFDAVKNSNTIQIAENRQGGWGSAEVDLYNVKVYNRALGESEIQQNFNAIRDRYGI